MPSAGESSTLFLNIRVIGKGKPRTAQNYFFLKCISQALKSLEKYQILVTCTQKVIPLGDKLNADLND